MRLTHCGDGNKEEKGILFSYRKLSYSFFLLSNQGETAASLQLFL